MLLAGCPPPSEDGSSTPAITESGSETGSPCEMSAWYADIDEDGHGAGNPVLACEAPDGHVATDGDCDDQDPERHPEAEELCDTVDQDCDGQIDEGHAVHTWYRDTDGDGYGTDALSYQSCEEAGEGWSTRADDCNDDEPGVNPGEEEVCGDGADNDCNGLADCEDALCLEACTEQDCFDGEDDDHDGDVDCFDLDCLSEKACYLSVTSQVLSGSAEVRIGTYLEGFYSPSGEPVVTSSAPLYESFNGEIVGRTRFVLQGWSTSCSWSQAVHSSYVPPEPLGDCAVVVNTWGSFGIWGWLPEQHWTSSAFRLTDYRPWIHGDVSSSQQLWYSGTYTPSYNSFIGSRKHRFTIDSVQPGSSFVHYP